MTTPNHTPRVEPKANDSRRGGGVPLAGVFFAAITGNVGGVGEKLKNSHIAGIAIILVIRR